MQKDILYTKKAPEPIGPYSQGIYLSWESQKLIFTSGQVAIDPATNAFKNGNIKEQTKQVLENISSLLAESGSDFKRVVKTTVYLKHMTDFDDMNAVYSEYFGESKPARSTVGVQRLPKDALVEIEVIAYI